MSATIQELMKQKEEIERAIQAEKERQRAEGIEKIKVIINQYGLDINDIFPHQLNRVRSLKLTPKKVAPKYRNPESGETWTGRGKEPLWIAGKDRSLFLI